MLINEKIRTIRILKSLTQENIADELNISQRAYSKMEYGETKVTDDKLNKIYSVLKVSKEFIEKFNTDRSINQTNNDNSTGIGFLENLNQASIDIIIKLENQYEQRIKDLKEEILFLRNKK